MFREFFRFELRYQLRAPLVWVLAFAFALFAFTATTTNVTDPIDRQVTTQTGAVWLDHPTGAVLALAREGACDVYVGGEFDYAGGVRANGIARYRRYSVGYYPGEQHVVFKRVRLFRKDGTSAEIPAGDVMNVSQALAMNMIAVPTMLRATPSAMCTSGWNFPQP